uniref:C6 domain-containing protein n=1 Tax=Ascaris lumbricoides TaxID=6252 RepID=A0A0M3II97_ASCLU
MLQKTIVSGNVTMPATPLPPNVTVPTILSSDNVTTPTIAPPLNNITASMTSLPTANDTVQATSPYTTDVTASGTSPPTTNVTVPITAPPTASPGSPCTICPVLTPEYLVTAEGKDGKLLLDHYKDETGCRNVYVQCASETSSERAAIIFNGNISNPFAIASGVVQTTLQCNTETQWTYANETFAALTVSCIVLPAENATTDITTTMTPLTSTANVAPSCITCSSLSVGWVKDSLMTNGMVVMDHSRVNGCDVLLVSCSSHKSDAAVDILDSTGLPLAAGVGIVNVTFSCSDNAKWLIFGGQEVIQILCVTPKATTITSIPTVATTITLSTSVTASSNALTTTVSRITAPIISSSNAPANSSTTATTVAPTGSCAKCTILNVATTDEEGYIDGDIITNRVFVNGCMQIYVTCINPQPDGYTLLRSTTNMTLAIGNGTAHVTLLCNNLTEWQTLDEVVVPGVICVAEGCSLREIIFLFNENFIQAIWWSEFRRKKELPDGYTLLRSTTNMTLAIGNGTAHVTLVCNNLTEWQTLDEVVVPGVICVAEGCALDHWAFMLHQENLQHNFLASCRMCPNLKPLAIPNNAAIETNGNLAIQHFYGTDGCREAQVFCSGGVRSYSFIFATDNAMVSFNGDFQNIVVSDLNKVSLLLMCTANATWSWDGIIENINSVTCALTGQHFSHSQRIMKKMRKHANTFEFMNLAMFIS